MKKLNKKVTLTGDTIEKFYVPCVCYCSCNADCDCYDGFFLDHNYFEKAYANGQSSRSNSDAANYAYANS